MTYEEAIIEKQKLPSSIVYDNYLNLLVVIAPLNENDFLSYRKYILSGQYEFNDETSKLFSTDGKFCIAGIGQDEGDTFYKVLQTDIKK